MMVTRHALRALSCGLAAGLALGVPGCEDNVWSVRPDAGVAASTPSPADDPTPAPSADAAAAPADAGHAAATLSAVAVDFGPVGCGATPAAKTLTITNGGAASLAVTATTVGAAFSVAPTLLSVPPGSARTLSVTAAVPGSASAGQKIDGALNLFTNDPNNGNVTVGLTATASGATLTFAPGTPTSAHFVSAEVGYPAPSIPIELVNAGNAPATFTVAAPSSSRFTLDRAGVAFTLAPGGAWSGTAGFTPTDAAPASATSNVASVGTICGASLGALTYSGQGATGVISGWPTQPIDFGSSDCGGPPPHPLSFTLINNSAVDVHITSASTTGGFTSTAAPGRTIPANGGILAISVSAPPVPATSSLTPLAGTLTIRTDADSSDHVLPLTVEPHGAILAFDTSGSGSFGNFGQVVLLASATQPVAIKNVGNGPANLTLGTTGPFHVGDATFSLPGHESMADSVTFAPTAAGGAEGGLSMSTASALCAPLPSSVPLSGVGIGGGPSVSPTTLSFTPPCGGPAPAPQAFTVRNQGTANMSWTLGALSGPGASRYTVTTNPAPGLLLPGEGAVVTVTAAAVPSPAVDPTPSTYDAQLTIETDVPYDNPHVVTLGTTPLGDQLSFSAGTLKFGQLPIGTAVSQPLIVSNRANPGSPAANATLVVQGTGASGYSVAPGSVTNLGAGNASDALSVTFAPAHGQSYPAAVSLVTSDPLCTPLPAPVTLVGTGTQGEVLVSATALAFGTDPTDPAGLVDCGATGLPRTLTIANVGNQAFHVTGVALGRGAASPYRLTGASALPLLVPIGGGATIGIAPGPVPAVADPNDASAYADALTVTTDAAQDAPHRVSLLMQPRGAVIVGSPPPATWPFGTIGFGSIATFTSTIRNTGNAPATVSLTGLSEPNIFGLQGNPTSATAGSITSLVGQFVPPAASGTWADHGTLTVHADAFCAPLPPSWNGLSVALSGSSNGAPPVTIAGSLAFGVTSCGSDPPGAKTVTLTNGTNVAQPYVVALRSGAHYTLVGQKTGTLAANGTAAIAVAPQNVVPGPGVEPGSAPYADDLLVTVSTSPPTSFTIPITWQLAGAVLSLPDGVGPYTADSSGLTLPMDNAGSTAVTVSLVAQPATLASFLPAPQVRVNPGIRALPEIVSGPSTSACPATTNGTVTFLYTGPVCQPFPVASIPVHACTGAL
jgi:hypothetical protein